MLERRPEAVIAEACELELDRHGDSYRGAGYTRSVSEPSDQYTIMLGVIRDLSRPVSLLDLGCGLAHLADHLSTRPELSAITYTGIDISEKFIAAARERRSDLDLRCLNVLQSEDEVGQFDYTIMNGLFNYRGAVSFETMTEYWLGMIATAFRHSRMGIAFNVMSKIVDWERDDLFHLPFDTMARHVSERLSRHFVVRHDYGRYEYTVYVYHQPFKSE